MIWDDTEDEVLAESKRHRFHLPAPKSALPGHAESYNPPDEYLMTKEEIEAMEAGPDEDRKFIPKKHTCLRHVAGYDNFVKERFERCLDLYLCPRKLKRRLNIDPETLVPRLPKPKELRPFPNMLCMQYLGHSKGVRSIAVSPDGQFLVSGSDDCTVRLWEVDTSLCRYSWKLSDPVVSVSWNPNGYHHIVAAVCGKKIVLISTGTGDKDSNDVLETFLGAAEGDAPSAEEGGDGELDGDSSSDEEDKEGEEREGDKKEDNKPVAGPGKAQENVVWRALQGSDEKKSKKTKGGDENVQRLGPRVELVCEEAVTQAVWHYRGDYLAAVVPTAGSRSVSVHQVRWY
jgi:ribosome biogenesis protein ERB1